MRASREDEAADQIKGLLATAAASGFGFGFDLVSV